jgi:small subunit ribosomal protein S18
MARKVKLKISGRLLRKKTRRGAYGATKQCRFCSNAQVAIALDYKNVPLLKNFLTERGKILPSRISGTCAKHQRLVTTEIKQARIMALLPFTASQF